MGLAMTSMGPCNLQRQFGASNQLRRHAMSTSSARLCVGASRKQNLFKRRNPQPVRAASETEEKEPDQEQKDKMIADMKKGGLDKATALKVLKKWEEVGASDPETLSKVLQRQSLGAVVTIVIQALLDAGAAYGGIYLGNFLAQADRIPLHWVWSFGASFVGSYFAVGVVLDLFTLGALTASSIQFQTNSAAFLSAVKEIAGQDTGLNVIDKAAQAVNTVKVFNALNAISDMLKMEGAKRGSEKSTLGDLSVYLLLSQASSKYGFDYEEEGLTAEEAGNIAALFARFDLNDDGKIDVSELTKLADELNAGMTKEEIEAGFKLLDKDNSKSIEFPEFVSFYQKKMLPWNSAELKMYALADPIFVMELAA